MTIKEHDRVVLTDDIGEKRLKAGDVGAVVHIYPGAEAYVVEFLTLDGYTEAVVHVRASQIRSVSKSDIAHARNIDIDESQPAAGQVRAATSAGAD